jgi:hypothetical protein
MKRHRVYSVSVMFHIVIRFKVIVVASLVPINAYKFSQNSPESKRGLDSNVNTRPTWNLSEKFEIHMGLVVFGFLYNILIWDVDEYVLESCLVFWKLVVLVNIMLFYSRTTFFLKFYVFTSVNIRIRVFWDVIPCTLVDTKVSEKPVISIFRVWYKSKPREKR